ncbi:hypothetical protein DSO57_1023865 [Entomophthora muscae]|uniref:Uncharacterized protein n=1 Tax=Entomophthora muscae TaxID=34485 RepID=A0ACC2RTS4_9FUNG|nr:hypothetical protein DSO57_1023865 [Entomophthora muscae]
MRKNAGKKKIFVRGWDDAALILARMDVGAVLVLEIDDAIGAREQPLLFEVNLPFYLQSIKKKAQA